jgi:hypothetical protein
MSRLIPLRNVIFAAALLIFTGCGGGNAPQSAADIQERSIKQVGQLYANFVRDNQKPPSGIKDLARYAAIAPNAFNAVKNGDVEVIWDIKLADPSAEGTGDSADEVLAFEKQVPTEGGEVLMKNRTVKKMTADEFKAAKKASKG